MKIVTILTIILLFSLNNDRADCLIDGTITPSYVQNTYNFSNGESAKGFVSFLKGFKLPPNGNVTLNLAPGSMINGTIDLNGGTLKSVTGIQVLLGPDTTTIVGTGSIDANNVVIMKELICTGTIYFTDGNPFLSARSKARMVIKPTSLIDFASTAGSVNLRNLQIVGFERMQTYVNHPTNLSLQNVDLIITSPKNVVLPANILSTGNSSISTGPKGSLLCAGFIRNNGGTLTIKSLATVQATNIILPLRGSELILDNAALDIYNSASLNLPVQVGNIGSPSIGGKMTVKGRSRMSSTGNHTVTFPKNVELLISSKSNLELAEGFHLVFQ